MKHKNLKAKGKRITTKRTILKTLQLKIEKVASKRSEILPYVESINDLIFIASQMNKQNLWKVG